MRGLINAGKNAIDSKIHRNVQTSIYSRFGTYIVKIYFTYNIGYKAFMYKQERE
jgi:hypothetical protein